VYCKIASFIETLLRANFRGNLLNRASFLPAIAMGTAVLAYCGLSFSFHRHAKYILVAADRTSFYGSRPVLLDIEEDIYEMSLTSPEAAITPRSKAVTPFHLFGHMGKNLGKCRFYWL